MIIEIQFVFLKKKKKERNPKKHRNNLASSGEREEEKEKLEQSLYVLGWQKVPLGFPYDVTEKPNEFCDQQ